MEKSTTYKLNISELRSYIPMTNQIGIGDDFCMFNIKSVDQLRALEYPCRFEGLMVIYCSKGHLKLAVNLNEYELRDRHLVIVSPEKIVKVTMDHESGNGEIDLAVVAMSPKFASDIHIDFRRLMNEALALKRANRLLLSEEQKVLMEDYFRLMSRVVQSENAFMDNTLSSLVSSMISYVAGVWSEKLRGLDRDEPQATSRGRMVFEQFIRLAGEYHTQYRNVGFYADKLCLTPKYLSKLIKTASGKSAPEWIDSFVIMEAMNLLKYSDISIKEIVYRLNFPNQSVFYKFFKSRTGMTPTEYRNS